MRDELTRWVAVLWVLGLLGCGGNDDTFGDDDDDDATAGDDDAGDDDDTTGTPGGACGDESWPDVTAEPFAGCTPEVPEETWQLQQTWSWGQETSCSNIRAGYFVDVDGDGVVSTSEPMQLWLHTDGPVGGEDHDVLLGFDGTLYADILPDTYRAYGTIGEVDASSEGMEYLASYYYSDQAGSESIAAYGPQGLLWETLVESNLTGKPWLTDLEGDGIAELLLYGRVHDATSGDLLLELAAPGGVAQPVAVDLDLDGQREILTATSNNTQNVNVYGADGARIATCWAGQWDASNACFAAANLDDDPEIEFLAAVTGFLVACDSDGSLMAETFADLGSPNLVGVGQLDADAPVEVVVSDSYGVFGFDHDFTQMWRYDLTEHPYDSEHSPLTLADLDGNGTHEVLVRFMDTLVILDGGGNEVTTLLGDANCSNIVSAPAVVDMDADGLAEIVVPAWPDVAVVENPFGGWAVEGSDEPWPGPNKYPGDRRLDGSIPLPAEEPWGDPGTNVWQGLPAAEPDPAYFADLTGEIVEVCEDGDDSGVVVYVNNHGYLETDVDCSVTVYSLSDGSLLGSAIMPAGLPSGTGRAVEVVVPTSAVVGGLELVVDEANDIAECDDANNTAVWPSP